jgi:hypothetical protein
MRPRLLNAIERGASFYLTRFFAANGSGSYFPKPSRRSAQIVDYSEGLAAIHWMLTNHLVKSQRTVDTALSLVPGMIAHALRFLDETTNDVASDQFFGRNYHIQSLRWGSGPLMEALMYAIDMRGYQML